MNSGNPNVTIPVTGFQTPSSGAVRTRLGFVAYEGDAGSTGDSVRLNTTTISDPANPPQNFFNSAVSTDGVAVTSKDPNYVNQLGFDSILARADGVLANGATSAAIHLTTGGETYFPGAVTFATDLYSPDVSLVKSVEDLNGGQVTPGDVLRYTVTARNDGQDDAVGVVLRDPIPADATYMPGTLTVDGVAKNDDYPGTDTAGFDATTNTAVFWVGTGAAADAGGTLARNGGTATVTFDVRVGAVPSGTTIDNAAHADFFAATVGVPLVADSNTTSSTVAAPDLTISKTPSAFSVAVPGGTQTFQLTATNVGDAPTSGTVTVTDPVGATGFDQLVSAGGTGWTCAPATLPALAPVTLSCTRNDPLAAGGSYPPISVTLRTAISLSLSNTATVAGGGDTSPADNSDTAVGNGTVAADLQLEKTADVTTAPTGSRVTFTLHVHNDGPSPAANVTVSDTSLAANYSVDEITSSQGNCTALPCNLGTLPSGEDATVTIRATVTTTGSSADNTATVSSDTPDSTPGNNTATVPVTVPPTADLSVTKTAAPDPLDTTQPATYTLTVHNAGPHAATDSELEDSLPTGFTVTNVTPPAGSSCDPVGASGVLRCHLGTLAAGATVTVAFTGTLSPSSAGTIVLNSARVQSAVADTDVLNNNASTATLAIPSADLELTKTPSTIAPVAGHTVSFALTLVNHGPSVASGARVTDTLPAGLTVVSAPGCTAAGATLTCDAGTLASGDSQTFTVTAQVALSAAGHDVVNVASATSDVPDHVRANNSDEATLRPTSPPPGALPPTGTPPPARVPPPTADLALTKSGSRGMIVGRRARYVLTVTNRGPDTATGIVVTDRLPSRLRFVASSAHPGRCSGGRAVRCTLGSLAAHAQMRIMVTVVPRAGGGVVNSAQVAAATADSNRSNNTARARSSILRRTRLAVTKRADRASVASGGLIRYRITVRNAGRAAAIGVTVCDRPSRGLALVRFHGARLRGGAACWSIQRLAMGRRRSFAVLARATSTRSGRRVINAVSARGANLPRRRAAAAVRVLPAAGRPGGVTG